MGFYPKITHEQHMAMVNAIRVAECEALEGKRAEVYLHWGTWESSIWTGSRRKPWPKADVDKLLIWRVEPHTIKKLYSKDKNFQYIDWKNPNYESTLEYQRLLADHLEGIYWPKYKFPLSDIIHNAYEAHEINGAGLGYDEVEHSRPDKDNEIDYSDLDDDY